MKYLISELILFGKIVMRHNYFGREIDAEYVLPEVLRETIISFSRQSAMNIDNDKIRTKIVPDDSEYRRIMSFTFLLKSPCIEKHVA